MNPPLSKKVVSKPSSDPKQAVKSRESARRLFEMVKPELGKNLPSNTQLDDAACIEHVAKLIVEHKNSAQVKEAFIAIFGRSTVKFVVNRKDFHNKHADWIFKQKEKALVQALPMGSTLIEAKCKSLIISLLILETDPKDLSAKLIEKIKASAAEYAVLPPPTNDEIASQIYEKFLPSFQKMLPKDMNPKAPECRKLIKQLVVRKTPPDKLMQLFVDKVVADPKKYFHPIIIEVPYSKSIRSSAPQSSNRSELRG